MESGESLRLWRLMRSWILDSKGEEYVKARKERQWNNAFIGRMANNCIAEMPLCVDKAPFFQCLIPGYSERGR